VAARRAHSIDGTIGLVTTTPATPLPGVLGEYEVLAPIAARGVAEIHLARLRGRPERLVALKVLRPELARDGSFVSMFLDEARLAARLSHPNIVEIHGLRRDGARHYLAMELLRGRTLLETWETSVARGRALP
jgi:serine/threonine protein kinase